MQSPFEIKHQNQVFIYCTGHESHKRWQVVTFARGSIGTIWSPADGIGPTPKPLKGVAHSRSRLHGNQLVDPAEMPAGDPATEARERWKLTCKYCHTSVSVTREKLTPILDRLVSARVSELSLIGLAASLRMQ